MNFKQYKRKGLSEMVSAVEFILNGGDLTKVSISEPDKLLDHETFEQGYIARNPNNHEDLWYVAKKYFDDNLEPAETEHKPMMVSASQKLREVLQEYMENVNESDNITETLEDVITSLEAKSATATTELTFGQAIEAAKQGHRVARKGWNGSGMFAYIVPANIYPAQTGAAKAHFGENAMVPYREYWALKTAQNDIATWAPSGSDSLAEDWMILD